MPMIGSRVSRAQRDELVDRPVMAHVLVPVGDHGTALVPATPADDVHLGGQERVGVAHDRTDVHVVLPVLDRHVERMPAAIEIGHDGVVAPVAVLVDHVAPIAVREQLRIETRIVGPRLRVRADADLALRRLVGHRHALQPPLNEKNWPVWKRDRPSSRTAVNSASSSIVPNRCIGTCASIFLRRSGSSAPVAFRNPGKSM